MRIVNFGSLNVDHVYRVPHIVRPGETIASRSYQLFAGGKGANQSMALARAGATVHHAGCIGQGGRWVVDKLAQAGVDIAAVRELDEPTGQAVIQVDDAGENAIFLFAGTNHRIAREQVARTLASFGEGDLLLAQNEINDVGVLIEQAAARGLQVCLNPAPFTDDVPTYPLHDVDWLVLNETEACGVAQVAAGEPEQLLAALTGRYPQSKIVLTLGARGAIYSDGRETLSVAARPVDAVDTTAAGDTFIGYFLAAIAEGQPVRAALDTACAAAAICVSRMGAMDSIPTREEVGR